MAREARCGKGQGIPACSGDLNLGGRVAEPGARACGGGAGRRGPLPAAAGEGTEAAWRSRVEAVPEREALAWQQEAVLVVGDLMHVVAEEIVVPPASAEDELEAGHVEIFGGVADGRAEAQAAGREAAGQAPEPEEKAMQPQRAQRRRSGPSFRSPLEALEAVQFELRAQQARGSRAYCRLRRRIHQRRQLHLEHRRNIIQCIPGFWAKAQEASLTRKQIVNHPHISALISEQDEDMLSYLTHLEVQEMSHHGYHCQLKFFFRSNPYFLNDVIVKTYHVSIAGFRACQSTPVRWYWDYEHGRSSRRRDSTGLNFFNWLSASNCPESSRIAEIISEDLWPDPLQYYPRDADSRGGS